MSDKLSVIKQQIELTRPTFEQLAIDKTAFAKELEWAMQLFKENTYLQGMESESVKNCLVNLALCGLSLNPIKKEAYLVPRKGKCCIDPSYRALSRLVTDSGSVVSIKVGLPYSNEPFDIEQGTKGYVKHGIAKNGDRGNPIGAYSIAALPGGTYHVEWMYESELQDIKKRSEAVKSGKRSPWDSDESEMKRKTILKRHTKYLPKSDNFEKAAHAIAWDDESNGIDFEAERRQAEQQAAKEKAQTLNIDLLDPNNPEHVEKWNGLLALFQDKSLPAKWTTHKGAEFDKKATGMAMYEEFQAGTLTIAKANKTGEYLKQAIEHFKTQKTEE